MVDVQCLQHQTNSRVGLNRILTPISGLAGWVIVVAGVLSSAQVLPTSLKAFPYHTLNPTTQCLHEPCLHVRLPHHCYAALGGVCFWGAAGLVLPPYC